jgi:energy-coupling factor transporter ATP-binding protein EcfA2
MNIEALHLKNFKRFSDLTLDLSSLATAPKLILLIGANGSGKSSIFDAFEYLSGPAKGLQDHYTEYFQKRPGTDMSVACTLGGGVGVQRINNNQVSAAPTWDGKSAFYGRSSFRTVPELSARANAPIDLTADEDRPRRFIEQDMRFATDVAQITENILHEVWGEPFDSDTMRARFTDPINEALERVFSGSIATGLRLLKLIPSLSGKPPDIRFQKGGSEVHYDLLSSGEKEVFNVLLNLFIRNEHFPNAVYFIDELDVHLHTRLQHALLREVVEHWIPDCSQLWTASHSLGFIEYASEAADAAIIDFDDLDFDRPQVLAPSPKSPDIFDIAVPRDSALKVFPNQTLVVCENQDAVLYNAIQLLGLLFVGARDKNAVGLQTRTNDEFRGLIDRDFLGSHEIEELRREQPNLFVLGYYSLESYLYHPLNLAAATPPGFDETEYRGLLQARMVEVRDRLLMTLERSRNSYEILKALPKETKDRAMQEIAEATASKDFETFYPFLDMKTHRPGNYLAPLNQQPLDLARTAWLRRAIADVLGVA